jgi:hypothetical protein
VENQPNYKKYVFIAIGTLAGVTTNNSNNTITLTSNIDAGKDASSKKYTARNKLSLNLPAGDYLISVEGNSVATNQVVKLKGRKTQTYNINPINASGVEPVIFQNAQNAVADNSELIYLNGGDGLLYKVDNQNNIAKLTSSPLKSVKWASKSFGVGLGEDGNLYTVNGGSMARLKLPFSYSGGIAGFDISASKQIYASSGADVYTGTLNSSFTKIYTSGSSSPTVVAGPDKVAVADETLQGTSTTKPLLAIIDLNGKTVKKSIGAGRMFWSPNGKYLVSADEDGAQIYDQSIKAIDTIPSQSFVEHVAWLNDSSLFYSTNDQLWVYDTASHKAQLTANMPLGSGILELSLSSNKNYVYMTTLNPSNSDDFAIRRIGLQNQQVPGFIYQLQSILPKNVNDITLSLVNFSQPPSVLVNVFPDSSTGAQAALQEAQTELMQDGFDLSKIKLQVSSP